MFLPRIIILGALVLAHGHDSVDVVQVNDSSTISTQPCSDIETSVLTDALDILMKAGHTIDGYSQGANVACADAKRFTFTPTGMTTALSLCSVQSFQTHCCTSCSFFMNDVQGRHTQWLPGEGRHIQWLPGTLDGIELPRNLAGIGDRMYCMTRYVRLAAFHNATLHIADSPSLYLTTKHSKVISKSWSHYLNMSQFSDPLNSSKPCYETSTGATLRNIFEEGRSCVNFRHTCYDFPELMARSPKDFLASFAISPLPISRDVLDVAHKWITGFGMNKYGYIHIRRCDRLVTNADCTKPETISASVATFPSVRNWVIFHYSEPGYKDNLSKELLSLPNLSFVFEDELDLIGVDSSDIRLTDKHDNYFQTLVANRIAAEASVVIDTHNCKGNPTPDSRMRDRVSGSGLMRDTDDREMSAQALTLADDTEFTLSMRAASGGICDPGRRPGS
jgi:hypothetical protein